jgi:hypothetical protein
LGVAKAAKEIASTAAAKIFRQARGDATRAGGERGVVAADLGLLVLGLAFGPYWFFHVWALFPVMGFSVHRWTVQTIICTTPMDYPLVNIPTYRPSAHIKTPIEGMPLTFTNRQFIIYFQLLPMEV